MRSMPVLRLLACDLLQVVEAFKRAHPYASETDWLGLHAWCGWTAIGPHGVR